MTKYKYDPRWPWEIIFWCKASRSSLQLHNCTTRLEYGSCHNTNCKDRKNAIKQRFKDMTTKDPTGIMLGCLSCRYCVFFHKQPRTVKAKKFHCRMHDPVPLKKIDTFRCSKFHLKRFINCPERAEVIMCNDCLWDYHTEQDYCENCKVFSCESNTRLKIRKPKKPQLKKKPKLKLKKSKPKLKLRKKK